MSSFTNHTNATVWQIFTQSVDREDAAFQLTKTLEHNMIYGK